VLHLGHLSLSKDLPVARRDAYVSLAVKWLLFEVVRQMRRQAFNCSLGYDYR